MPLEEGDQLDGGYAEQGRGLDFFRGVRIKPVMARLEALSPKM